MPQTKIKKPQGAEVRIIEAFHAGQWEGADDLPGCSTSERLTVALALGRMDFLPDGWSDTLLAYRIRLNDRQRAIVDFYRFPDSREDDTSTALIDQAIIDACNDVRDIAAAWRAEHPDNQGGVVVVFHDQVAGWMDELRDPNHWEPGCIAVDEQGNEWIATGGNAQDGADRWNVLLASN